MDFHWLSPYKILQALGRGLYRIEGVHDADVIPRIHGVHLKKYHTPSVEKVTEISIYRCCHLTGLLPFFFSVLVMMIMMTAMLLLCSRKFTLKVFNMYCTCRMPKVNGISMIHCNNCKEWYHGVCIGTIPEEIKAKKWFCPTCCAAENSP